MIHGPNDWNEPKLHRNGTDAVVDVAKGRAHRVGGDAEDVLNSLAGPSELGDDSLVSEGGQTRVRPGVDTGERGRVSSNVWLSGPVRSNHLIW